VDANYHRLPSWNLPRWCPSVVNWDKVGNDTSAQIQHWAANVDVSNVHSLFHTLGIPVSGGLALGFLAGFVRTR